MGMKSRSVTSPTRRSSCTTGRHEIRSRRMISMASMVGVPGATVRGFRSMTSRTGRASPGSRVPLSARLRRRQR
jgi:hypothetical protein